MIATTQTSQLYTFTPGASPSTYNIPFGYRQQAEIFAIMSQTGLPNLQLTQGVDFSLTLPSPTGGTLTKMGTWDVRYGNLTIFRSTPHVNEESVVDGGGIVADRLEFMIDELTQMIQEIGNGNIPTSGYALTFPTSDPPGLSYVLPVVATRALQQLTFDASGAPVVTAPAGAAINAAWQAGLAQSQVIALQIAFGLIPAGSTIDKMQFDMENRHRLGEYVWTDDYRCPVGRTTPPTRRTIGRASTWRTATRRSPRLTGRWVSPTFSASPSPTSAGRERKSRPSGARGGRSHRTSSPSRSTRPRRTMRSWRRLPRSSSFTAVRTRDGGRSPFLSSERASRLATTRSRTSTLERARSPSPTPSPTTPGAPSTPTSTPTGSRAVQPPRSSTRLRGARSCPRETLTRRRPTPRRTRTSSGSGEGAGGRGTIT